MTNMIASFAASGALVSGLALAFCAACTPAEPPTTSPNSPPDAVDPHPDGPSGFSAPDINVDIAPEMKAEAERMMRIMRETKPGGCDPPPLLPFGTCEQLATCDSFPFRSGKTADVKVFLMVGGQVPPGTAIDIELIKCGATPSTVMTRTEALTRTEDVVAAWMPKEIAFSVPTEPKGKYLLRLTNKTQTPGVVANYLVNTSAP